MKLTSPFTRYPWLYVVLAFVILIAMWSTLITIAVKHSPEVIPVAKPNEPSGSSQPAAHHP